MREQHLQSRADTAQPGDYITIFGREIGPIEIVTLTSSSVVTYHLGVGQPRRVLRRNSDISIRRPLPTATITVTLNHTEINALSRHLATIIKAYERTGTSTAATKLAGAINQHWIDANPTT